MKKILLIAGSALAIAAVPAAAVGATGFHGSFGSGDKTQATVQDAARDKDQTRLHLQDGTGDHADGTCDGTGTGGDMHRYHGSD